MKNFALALMIALTSLAAHAGCEDGSDTAEFEARGLLAREQGVHPKKCKSVWLDHADINGSEVHFVDVVCGRTQAVVKVKLREIEDAMCTTEGAKLAAPRPSSPKAFFPSETTGLQDMKRFRKIHNVDARALAKTRYLPPVYAELIDLAFGRDVTLSNMAQSDGHFTKWVDTLTGLVFWQVSYYPGDNEVGALVEVWANHVRGEADLRVMASVGDSWIEWN